MGHIQARSQRSGGLFPIHVGIGHRHMQGPQHHPSRMCFVSQYVMESTCSLNSQKPNSFLDLRWHAGYTFAIHRVPGCRALPKLGQRAAIQALATGRPALLCCPGQLRRCTRLMTTSSSPISRQLCPLFGEQESQCKLQVGSEPLTATIECFTLSAQPQEGPKHTLVAFEVCSPRWRRASPATCIQSRCRNAPSAPARELAVQNA